MDFSFFIHPKKRKRKKANMKKPMSSSQSLPGPRVLNDLAAST
jgi:hypothetical protein